MSAHDILLKFAYSDATNADLRTFSVHQLSSTSPLQSEVLYKFYHPATGLANGMTTFYRKNAITPVLETAGQIEWLSEYNAIVHFGLDQAPIRQLRRAKKPNSKSRRFKACGCEYKWKRVGSGDDLYCVDARGKAVANWSQEKLHLRVATKAENILDRIVVTCLVNLWFLRLALDDVGIMYSIEGIDSE
ncbi:hypothetical protein BDQ12DRAFT_709150 [Crucibulum laeve]|uniref:DUF6593 domain-containing protein n=1 Tax=Crucibulum laeve TaxID=68775 RepID=A0A5C3MDR2_9AGAR|nr:hypothetical protein BDQ12DRAFT_709150 [Crucibulum laeve]